MIQFRLARTRRILEKSYFTILPTKQLYLEDIFRRYMQSRGIVPDRQRTKIGNNYYHRGISDPSMIIIPMLTSNALTKQVYITYSKIASKQVNVSGSSPSVFCIYKL